MATDIGPTVATADLRADSLPLWISMKPKHKTNANKLYLNLDAPFPLIRSLSTSPQTSNQ